MQPKNSLQITSSLRSKAHAFSDMQKHGEICRHQYPRPPVRETTTAIQSDPPSKEEEEVYVQTLTAVQEELKNFFSIIQFIHNNIYKSSTVLHK